MHAIHKTIVTDDEMRPVAVQIAYNDWVEIEQSLKLAESKPTEKAPTLLDPSQFAGVIHLEEDPLAFQSRIRGEWR